MKNKEIKRYLSDGNINPEYLEMLKRKALIESTGASLRLSGRNISNATVAEILKKIEE